MAKHLVIMLAGDGALLSYAHILTLSCWCLGTDFAPGRQQPPWWLDYDYSVTWTYHMDTMLQPLKEFKRGRRSSTHQLLCYPGVCLLTAIAPYMLRNQHTQWWWPSSVLLHIQNQYLTHWDRDKMAAILQTTFSNTFSWMKIYEFWLRFHWSLILRVQLTIFHHWFR